MLKYFGLKGHDVINLFSNDQENSVCENREGHTANMANLTSGIESYMKGMQRSLFSFSIFL